MGFAGTVHKAYANALKEHLTQKSFTDPHVIPNPSDSFSSVKQNKQATLSPTPQTVKVNGDHNLSKYLKFESVLKINQTSLEDVNCNACWPEQPIYFNCIEKKAAGTFFKASSTKKEGHKSLQQDTSLDLKDKLYLRVTWGRGPSITT